MSALRWVPVVIFLFVALAWARGMFDGYALTIGLVSLAVFAIGEVVRFVGRRRAHRAARSGR